MANFFNYTAMTMAYIIYGPAMPGNRSHGLSMAIEKSMEQVKAMIERKEDPFNDALIEGYYQAFLDKNKPVTKR